VVKFQGSKLSTAKRVAVLAALVEGNSVRATAHDERLQSHHAETAGAARPRVAEYHWILRFMAGRVSGLTGIVTTPIAAASRADFLNLEDYRMLDALANFECAISLTRR
jgi:hypothetical protein